MCYAMLDLKCVIMQDRRLVVPIPIQGIGNIPNLAKPSAIVARNYIVIPEDVLVLVGYC